MSKENLTALPKGFKLQEYRLEAVLGHGGFGITYLAWDTHLNQWVAIKEYLPNDLAVRKGISDIFPKSSAEEEEFKWGLERFLDEARTLARFKHPNIVRTYRFFEDNGTAYMVMEYEKGRSLTSLLKTLSEPPDEETLLKILLPLIDGLQGVHAAGFLHRDIKPGNIFMREENGTPVLLDFGAARFAMGQKSRNITSIMTPGYAPFEQYQSKGNQGPWTDIYALGAVMYRAISGKVPPEATARSNAMLRRAPDPMEPAVEVGWGRYSRRFLEAIDRSLMVLEQDRPQSVEEWRAIILGTTDPNAVEIKTASAWKRKDGKGGTGKLSKAGKKKWLAAALLLIILLGVGGWYGYTKYFVPLNGSQSAHQLSPAEAARLSTLPIHKARTLQGHTKLIFSVAFSPNDKLLASGSLDETIRLWDVFSGKQILLFNTEKNGVNWISSVAFSPDGKTLASASFDEVTKLWDVSTGKEIRELRRHQKGVNSVAFSPDGNLLATGSEDRTIHIWNLVKMVQLYDLKGHTKEVTFVAFSPNGKILASASWDGTVRLWNVDTGKEKGALTGHTKEVSSVAFSPDGKMLASSSFDGTVRLWNADTGSPIRTLQGHESAVNTVKFSPNGKTLVSGANDIRFWDVEKGTLLYTLKGHTQDIFSLAFSPDGKMLASAGFDQLINIWTVK